MRFFLERLKKLGLLQKNREINRERELGDWKGFCEKETERERSKLIVACIELIMFHDQMWWWWAVFFVNVGTLPNYGVNFYLLLCYVFLFFFLWFCARSTVKEVEESID